MTKFEFNSYEFKGCFSRGDMREASRAALFQAIVTSFPSRANDPAYAVAAAAEHLKSAAAVYENYVWWALNQCDGRWASRQMLCNLGYEITQAWLYLQFKGIRSSSDFDVRELAKRWRDLPNHSQAATLLEINAAKSVEAPSPQPPIVELPQPQYAATVTQPDPNDVFRHGRGKGMMG